MVDEGEEELREAAQGGGGARGRGGGEARGRRSKQSMCQTRAETACVKVLHCALCTEAGWAGQQVHGNMQAHHAYMYCICAQRVIKLQIMYQAPILATVLKNKYIPSCMVHRRRIRKKIPNCLPAEASTELKLFTTTSATRKTFEICVLHVK